MTNVTQTATGPTWPTGSDYARSIQDPRSAFRSESLASATVAVDGMGMPLAASGQNTAVFLLRSGGGSEAVRCFTRPPSDGSQRYGALQSHLATSRPTSITDARWIDDGIVVNRQVWPIVVMPWVYGKPLNAAVEDLLETPDELSLLADRWVEAIDTLQAADITHGDLQHGNVLVLDDGRIALVDLDGVWVPGMRVGPPSESGHPNYQHPGYNSSIWGRHADSFSALLIETSLRALAADPSLGRYLAGENLVFTREDLVNTASGTWTAVRSSPDPLVIALAERLSEAATAPPERSARPFRELRAPEAEQAPPPTPPIPLDRAAAHRDAVIHEELPDMENPTDPADSADSADSAKPADSADWWEQTDADEGQPEGDVDVDAPDNRATSSRRSGRAVLGRNAFTSSAAGGTLAGVGGCAIAGALDPVFSGQALLAVFIASVSLLLGAFVVSWQTWLSGAIGAATRRTLLGVVLGGLAGLAALPLAHATLKAFKPSYDEDPPVWATGLTWAIVAALVGLAVGIPRGARTALLAMLGGGAAGFVGGLVFGVTVADYDGNLLLIEPLDPTTVVIVAGICLFIGGAIGLMSMSAYAPNWSSSRDG